MFKKFTILLMFMAVFAFVGGKNKSASADLVSGVSLGAQTIVDAANAMNDGKGVYFGVNASSGTWAGAYLGGSDTLDMSAYIYNQALAMHGSTFLSTFNVDPSANTHVNFSRGELNYNPAAGTTSVVGMSDGTLSEKLTLSVGAAFLYKMFATTGEIFHGDTMGRLILFLMTGETTSFSFLRDDPYNWMAAHPNFKEERLLRVMLELNNDIDYWFSDYNPDAYYEEIGNYSVFVLNAFDSNYAGDDQYVDILYIANAANPYDPAATPEPGTLLLLGLGLTSLPFARRLRKK